ncbi:RidA family protein [Flavobacteriaceae bacterium R33]|uniref:RidA family protein n=2 Tax=Poritiphilus flavus TaxID=2697053 RepID=A0A6L9EBM9_9FLAO|nr:RidA family protein [Poritiphilus flavus]
MENKKKHINPDGLFKSPAFSQIVTTRGNGKTIYIGGQNAVNANREIVGKNDLALQTDQVMKNLEIALKACDATFEDLVKLNINILQGQDARKGFEVSQKYLGQSSTQPIVTVLFVAGLVNPDFLVEIDAIAFVPEE